MQDVERKLKEAVRMLWAIQHVLWKIEPDLRIAALSRAPAYQAIQSWIANNELQPLIGDE